MEVKLLLLAIFCLGGDWVYGQNNCQSKEGAGELLEVGYRRMGTTAVYVDSIDIQMKNKKKSFKTLWKCETALSRTQERKSYVKVSLRKEGFDEWTEAKEVKLYKKKMEVKDTEPCTKYEVKLTLQIEGTSEIAELSKTFSVGPYYNLSTEEISVSKYKGSGQSYYEEITRNFRYEDITENSFTIRWEQFCGLSLSIWATPDGEEINHDTPYRTISTSFDNPITELVVEAIPCKTYEIHLEFYLDTGKSDNYFETEMLETVTTDPSMNDIKSRFGQYTYDEVSRHISWNFVKTSQEDQEECIVGESFILKVVGTDEELIKTDRLDFSTDLSPIIDQEQCTFQIQLLAQYSTESGKDKEFVGFIHDIEKAKIENSIQVEGDNILVVVDPCEEAGAEVSVGLIEVGRENREIEGRINVDEFLEIIEVDTDNSQPIPVSTFGDRIQSCVAYQISLTRSTDTELAVINFPNPPKLSTWAQPELDIGVDPIHFNVSDKETDGQCSVSKYEVECTDSDGETTVIEDDDITDLNPDTSYDCRGRIVHNIPGIESSFTTGWSEVKQFKTLIETTTSIPTVVTTEVVTQPSTTEEWLTTFATDKDVSNTDAVTDTTEHNEIPSEEYYGVDDSNYAGSTVQSDYQNQDVNDDADATEHNKTNSDEYYSYKDDDSNDIDTAVQSEDQNQEDNKISTAATDFTTVIVIVLTIVVLLVVFVSLYVWKFRMVHVKDAQKKEEDPTAITTTPNGIETIVEVPEDNEEVKKTDYLETKIDIINEIAPMANSEIEISPKKEDSSSSSPSEEDLAKKPQDESDSKVEINNPDVSGDSQSEATNPKDEVASPDNTGGDGSGVTDTGVSGGVDIEGSGAAGD